VRAPFSGKIGLRSISPGTYITPSLLVAKLVNINQLKISFSIPEKYANEVRSNSNLSFTVAGSTEKYTAKIYAIEPEVEISTRTLQVRAITENRDGKLVPGTFANVELPLDIIKDAVVIPSEAIVPVQNGKKVFIMKDGKAKETMIETTTRTDASVLVLSGIKAGDTLITGGVMSLKEDDAVKVKIRY
jgi:membrane fusion protein (multidrug efflux system)